MHTSSSRICVVRDQGLTASGNSAYPVWLTTYEELARLMTSSSSVSVDLSVISVTDIVARMNLATVNTPCYQHRGHSYAEIGK